MSQSKKPSRGPVVAREARPPGRRDPRVEATAPGAPRLPGVIHPSGTAAARRAPPVSTVSATTRTDEIDVGAELAAEREARARDAAALGEMFVKVVDADARRRQAEVAADALAQRVASLESQLVEYRARGSEKEAQVAKAGEARARQLQEALFATDDKLRLANEKLRAAEARARDAEAAASRMEQAATAAKHEASGTSDRITSLEQELLDLRAGVENGAAREEELLQRRTEAAARAAELESARARVLDLERSLGIEKEEHGRTAMRLTVAETRVEELTAQVHDVEQRAFSMEWESQKASADLEAARRRATGLEAEVARLNVRTSELERELESQRRAIEQAEQQVVTRLGDLEGARAAEVAARAAAEQAEMARAALESALRSIVSDLEEHEARASDMRSRTLAKAKDVMAATPKPLSARRSLSGVGVVRDEQITPHATPRGSVRGLARAAFQSEKDKDKPGSKK